ncbi:M23 family metallopeptidase [Streptomyces xiamenensis]|uniref:Secreted peptidase n=1 Tax=Streptomyces xiamenensis TaxID=408015 RepID=A0A0F7FSV0_9ACTN|nr:MULTISPECIES: LysM peptidoglycan-binding domain-containing M23 family metallopeptidase [Streptomyces]AKG43230.1 secreted peptidase [Streptomyces xiamenensis]
MSGRGRHRASRAHRFTRLTRASVLLAIGGAGIAVPLATAGAAHAADQPAVTATYTVKAGDTLSKIARDLGLEGGWKGLYADNKAAIGADAGLIKPGLKLELSTYAGTKTATAEVETPAAEPAPATGGWVSPIADGALATGYKVAGSMWASGYHTGIDFPAATGTPVLAVGDGEVISAGDGGSYGNQVVIKHADGHYSQYAHLSSLSVSAGQSVSAGDQIGGVGSTGNSTGPHLHFEIRTGADYGSDIDPLAFLRAQGVTL